MIVNVVTKGICAIAAVCLAAGCASNSAPAQAERVPAGDPPPASKVVAGAPEQAVASFGEALERNEVEAAIALLAEDFASPSMGSRDAAIERLREAGAHGWFTDCKTDISRMKVTRSERGATAAPLGVHANFGYAELEFELASDDGSAWQIRSLHWNQY